MDHRDLVDAEEEEEDEDEQLEENDLMQGEEEEAEPAPADSPSSTASSTLLLEPIASDPLAFRDLGALASWTVSSARAGQPISNVQDGCIETYWQSDGPQPHHIHIHFPRLVTIRYLSIYLWPEEDESYCPHTIKVLAGMGHHTLLDLQTLTLGETNGWRHFDLRESWSLNKSSEFQTRLLQLRVVANRLNGKDTRIRAIQLNVPIEKQHVTHDGIAFRTNLTGLSRDLFSESMLIR